MYLGRLRRYGGTQLLSGCLPRADARRLRLLRDIPDRCIEGGGGLLGPDYSAAPSSHFLRSMDPVRFSIVEVRPPNARA